MPQETFFYSTSSQQSAEQEAKKRKKRIIVMAMQVLYLLIIALTLVVLINRNNAVKSIDALNFQEAVVSFKRIPLGGVIFPKDSAYIAAAQLVVDKKFDEAAVAFGKLTSDPRAGGAVSEAKYQKAVYAFTSGDFEAASTAFKDAGEYRDSVLMEKESRCQLAAKLVAEADYDKALLLLLQLEREKYEPANGVIYQAYLAMAEFSALNGSYAEAFETCLKAEKYGDVSAQLAYYRDAAYQEAVTLYGNGDDIKSKRLFLKLEDYERSKDYVLLIKIRDNQYRDLFLTDEELTRSKSLVGLEDGSTLILKYNSTAIEFLEGSWTGLNCFFTVDEEGYLDYNLPYYDYGDYYIIEESRMLVYPEKDVTATKAFFRFTIISEDCIEIYAYNGGQTYKLYRD